ncbi:MAG: hypothetical protein WB870_09515 [Gallionellaceae bacterium]
MNPTISIQYRCGLCNELYRCEGDAQECCRREPNEAPVWTCAECDTEYGEEDMARYCCLDHDAVLPPTQEQLEAAGQKRLPL